MHQRLPPGFVRGSSGKSRRATADESRGGAAQGHAFVTLAVPTRWLQPHDDLGVELDEHLPPLADDDTVIVSEKVVVLLAGLAMPISALKVGPTARVLAHFVRPREGSRGLSVPEKMQYVVQTVGRGRVIVAAVAAALTRPLGRRGTFYRVAGTIARDVDGGRPPYEHLLFPPLSAVAAQRTCASLQRRLGVGVAIVDLNDFGGSIRATSSWSLPDHALLQILSTNPLGQRMTSTPFGIVREVLVGPAQERDSSWRTEPQNASPSGARTAMRPSA